MKLQALGYISQTDRNGDSLVPIYFVYSVGKNWKWYFDFNFRIDSKVNFTNWDAGQPSFMQDERCGEIHEGTWNDKHCKDLSSVVCQRPAGKEFDTWVIGVLYIDVFLLFATSH